MVFTFHKEHFLSRRASPQHDVFPICKFMKDGHSTNYSILQTILHIISWIIYFTTNYTLSMSIELYINWRLGFILQFSFGEGAILKWHPYVHVMPWWLEYEHQSWQKLLMKYGWRRHFGGSKVLKSLRMLEMNSDG